LGKLASALVVTSFGVYSVKLLITSDPVKVNFTPTGAVGVSFVPSKDSQSLPIGLRFDTPNDPMKVQFVGDGNNVGGESPTRALKQIADGLSHDQQTLKDANEQLTRLAQNSKKWPNPDIQASLNDLSGEVAKASSNLDQIGGKIGSLSADYNKAAQSQIDIAQKQSQTLQSQIPILYHALQRSTVSVEIPLHSSKAVALQTFDPTDGKLSASSVAISFDSFTSGPDGGEARIRVRSDDVQLHPATLLLHDGGSTILEGVGYRLTVTALQRHWILEHKILLTLTPEISPIEPNRQVLKAASGDEKAPQIVASK